MQRFTGALKRFKEKLANRDSVTIIALQRPLSPLFYVFRENKKEKGRMFWVFSVYAFFRISTPTTAIAMIIAIAAATM